MERLVVTVQELSLARDLDAVMTIVRRAARELTGADGATFVLRDQDCCYYADEDAIAPLWKGRRFPVSTCISGWVMQHRVPVAIENIYADPRIPAEAYRPTFVKSLVMVPIRTLRPVGAIGNYWAARHQPTIEEVNLLRALADSTAVAMENVRVSAELWQRQAELTQLHRLHTVGEMASVLAHELGQPLSAITAQGEASLHRLKRAPIDGAEVAGNIEQILRQAQRAGETIRELRRFLSRGQTTRERIDLNEVLLATQKLLTPEARAHRVRLELSLSEKPLPVAVAPVQIQHVLVNMIRNAIDAIRGAGDDRGTVAILTAARDGHAHVTVEDDGPGFDEAQRARLFDRFYTTKRDGLGIGLAICRNIIEEHHGTLSADHAPQGGAAFHFRLPLS